MPRAEWARCWSTNGASSTRSTRRGGCSRPPRRGRPSSESRIMAGHPTGARSHELSPALFLVPPHRTLGDIVDVNIGSVSTNVERSPLRKVNPRTRSPMEALDAISSIGQNQHVLRSLVEQVHSRLGIVPFVSAGLSIPHGDP